MAKNFFHYGAVRYGTAVLLSAPAFGLYLLFPGLHSMPGVFFFCAVALVARLFGFGPSAVCTIVSAALMDYAFFLPRGALEVTAIDLERLAAFLIAGFLIGSIAEQKAKVEKRAAETGASYATTLRSIGDGVIATDAQGVITFLNSAAETITGWKLEEARGEQLSTVFDIINEISGERVESPVRQVLQSGQVVGLANHSLLRTKDGRKVAIDDSGAPIRDDDGHLLGVILVFRDVSERRSLEREREAAQQRTERLLESILEGFIALDHDWRVVYVNQQAARMVELAREKMIGADFWKLFPPAVGGEFDQAYRRAIAERKPQVIEAFYGPLSAWFEVHAYPTPDGLSIFFENVTERRASEELIRQQSERFKVAEQVARLGTWEWNIQTGEFWWSTGMSALHGVAPNLAPSLEAWEQHIVPESRAQFHKALAEALHGSGVHSVDYWISLPDGATRLVSARGQVLHGDNGPSKMIGIALDITSRKQREEVLMRTEKLAATGRLAASIAHELNNPLEAVTNLLFLARHNPGKALEYIHAAEDELQRVSHVTKQTLGFYRDASTARPIRFAEALDGVLALYDKRVVGRSIEVRKHYKINPVVLAYGGEVRQVFSNIIVNALDALPERGILTVKLSPARVWTNSVRPGIRVTIADRGPGIPAEIRSKIWEPFFTTKSEVGTGLGLWLTQNIVKKHGGSIRVRSNNHAGRSGTVFSIVFPLSVAEDAAPKRQPEAGFAAHQ